MRSAALVLFVAISVSAGAGQKDREPVPVFGTTVVDTAGFHGNIYYIDRRTSVVPEKMERLKSRGKIYTRSLEVTPRHFTEGFPGVTKRFEWFAIDYKGNFWIEQAGTYEFTLTSDDGANLFIDGQLAVDNDGVHPARARSGAVELAHGAHSIEVAYFQGPRDEVALVLEVAVPGEERRIFRMDDFRPR
jgi:hypothetical protein